MHRPRVFFLISPLLTLALCAIAPASRAVQFPALFAVTVPNPDAQQAAQDAMREVLVRLTGTRDAATDPALAGLLADASHYVQLQRSTTGGATQIIFDATALRAAIGAAGRSVWDPDRPLLQVWLPPGDTAAAQELRSRLQAAAQARGLPISVAPFEQSAMSADGAASDALLRAARRAGADAGLLAQAGASDAADWQWTLAAADADGHWTGSPEAVIDGVADTLVRAARELENTPVADFDCHVEGVADLPSFTNVLGALSAAPGVTEVAVREIDADNLILHLKARGSEAALERALTSDHLHATGTAVQGALEYRYQAGL